MGIIKNTNKTGWIGNSSLHVSDIVDDIAIIDSVYDCPLMEAIFENVFESGEKDEMIKFHLTKIMHPFGRCCQAIIPEKANYHKILKIYVKILMEKNLPNVLGYQMFLAKPGTAHAFKMADFSTYGIHIKSGSTWHNETLGYKLYRVILSESNYLEEDPRTLCHNYKENSDYVQVRTSFFP